MCIVTLTKGLQLLDSHDEPLNTETLLPPFTVLRFATDTEAQRQANHKPSHAGQHEESDSERAIRHCPGPLEPERHVSCRSPASNAKALRYPSRADSLTVSWRHCAGVEPAG